MGLDIVVDEGPVEEGVAPRNFERHVHGSCSQDSNLGERDCLSHREFSDGDEKRYENSPAPDAHLPLWLRERSTS